MSENKFKKFVTGLFLTSEDKEVEKPAEVVETELSADEKIDEVKEIVEDVVEVAVQNTEDITEIKEELEAPDTYTKAEVDILIQDAITATVEAVQLSRDKAMEDANKELKLKIEAIELELQTPAKKAETVVPTATGKKVERFSMAQAIKESSRFKK